MSELGLYVCKSGLTLRRATSDFDEQSSVFVIFHFSGLTLSKPEFYKVRFLIFIFTEGNLLV